MLHITVIEQIGHRSRETDVNKGLHRVLLPLVLIGACLALTETAQANVVVGQTASAFNPPLQCLYAEPADEIQRGVASGTSYGVPSAGVITSWSTFAGPGPNETMTFKVFRRVGPFSYLVVAQSTYALIPNVLNTENVEVPVQKFDRIGLTVPGGERPTPCAFATGEVGDVVMSGEGDFPPGGTAHLSFLESGFRLNVSATVQLPPTITSISPSSGSFKGGTNLTIAGTDLSGAGVSFNGVPTPRVTPISDSQLSVVTPPTKRPTLLQITVTTVAGTATSPEAFSTTACVVPRLNGLKLKAVKRKLGAADCKLGRVSKLKGAGMRTGKVVKQSWKPGTLLKPGSKVNVRLARSDPSSAFWAAAGVFVGCGQALLGRINRH
jgi:IPT/TIG domain/PASTA domain